MFRVLLRKPALGTILGGLALIVSLGGIAAAAIPGSGGTIQGCYDPSSAKPPYTLNIVDDPAQCKPPSLLLPFNQQGPTGQTGLAGAAGPAGQAGEASKVYQGHLDRDFVNGADETTLRLALPLGAYAVTARVAFSPDVDAQASCKLVERDSTGFHDADEVTLFSGSTIVPADPALYGRHAFFQYFVRYAEVNAPLQIATTISSPGGLELSCRNDDRIDGLHMRIMAIRVGAVSSFAATAADESVLRFQPPLPRRAPYPSTIKVPRPVHHQNPPPRK